MTCQLLLWLLIRAGFLSPIPKEMGFHYTLDNIRSYNALFNFIILLRGVGKTYSFKKFAITEAMEKGDQFMYLRRTDVELQDSMNTFMNDVAKEFPGKEFRIRKNMLQYNIPDPDEEGCYLGNWEDLGHFAYLSNARRKKSVSYDKVKYMAFDEFLIPPLDKYASYLPDEVMVFLDFYETVARMRDVQVFFLSNAMSTINPYFLHFKLILPRSAKGIKRIGKDIVVEYHDNPEYREAKEKTRFGELVKDTRYGQYAIGNEFISENQDFIKKKTGRAFLQFLIDIGGDTVAVYRDNNEQEIYVSQDIDRDCPFRYKYREAGKGFLVFKNRKGNRMIDDLVLNFELGNVYFENQHIKQIMIKFFERIM